jgi:2-oxo-hept-3-ene-1,7-dioate hydratase
VLDTIADNAAHAGIVLVGRPMRPVACAADDTVHADYGLLGSISVRFV